MTRTDEPLVRIGQDDSLDKWLGYLSGLDCRCDYSWIGLGRWHGIDMGRGWVRITTHPRCPEHALCRGYTKNDRAKRDDGRYLYCPIHATKDCDHTPKRRNASGQSGANADVSSRPLGAATEPATARTQDTS